MKTKIINLPDLKQASIRKKEATVFDILKSEHLSQLREIVGGFHYFIKTYGCQANVRDEETMRGMLEDVGYQATDDVTKADLIIINTCAVRENAEDKVYGEIGNVKYLKRHNKNLIIALCGTFVW